MGTIMKKEYINEYAWSKMLKFLKSCKGIYLGTKSHCKKFIEAVYWMSRTGSQWRELHDRYGNWNSIFKRFNAWSKKNIWANLLQFCAKDPDLEYVMIDATIVRAHACAAGYGNQKTEGLGRSSGGFTSKIHTKVDALGNPLQFIVTPGQTSDVIQAKHLLNGVFDAQVLADKAYDSKKVRMQIKNQNCTDVIPSRSNSLEPIDYDRHIYKERHAIECFFGKIKYFRRVFSRFDKSARNFKAFLSFVGAIIWLR
jgi:transposase